jgi:hypothetical protein
VSALLKSRTTNKNFQLGAKLHRMDEQGYRRLGDGGEIFGDVLLTGVEGGCVDGRQHGEEFWLRSALAMSRVGLGWYAREVVL